MAKRLKKSVKTDNAAEDNGPKISEHELRNLVRTIVREELTQLQSQLLRSQDQSFTEGQSVDRLAEHIFEKYDDLFKNLA
ncbi:hypothetical protein [Lewinella sp. JB7]|uniref:hypothetical protein n=1 Tax=Lewinella sp. JB7 TaxID=2962887 RepID=UPI0020C9FFBD|nr:hypothetical protein [Lewinella sp. JB7]MCP9234348.1 hypothetical protein [Lewinella sp. JB7]